MLVGPLILMTALPAMAISNSEIAFEKDSLSRYTNQSQLKVKEELLWGFEESAQHYLLDFSDCTQGDNSGSVYFAQDSTCSIFHLTDCFSVDASSMQTITFKVDIWINDMSLLCHDHESGYPQNDYSHYGTLYFGVQDAAGRYHQINTSIYDNGGADSWQTLEFSLVHDNGKDPQLDYKHITGAYLRAIGRKGLEIKVDNLRTCYYSNEGYVPNTDGFPDGCRILSRCDAESLDGLLISEWYGSQMNFTDQKFGSSCLSFTCSTKDDYRIFFGGYNIPIHYQTDYICFWVHVPKDAVLATWFLEANQVQDTIEYENPGASVTNITQYAVDGFKYGEWNLIQLPLTALKKNNAGDTINLCHFRMVPTASNQDFTMLIDQVYLCNQKQATLAANEYRIERAKPEELVSIITTMIDALDVHSLDDKPAVQAARVAYDALSDVQKASVTNLQKLIDAESVIAELVKTIPYGDVDGNGKVEASDALEVLKSVVGKVTLTDEQFVKADTDGNGKADAADALNILKKVVGKIDRFPVEE